MYSLLDLEKQLNLHPRQILVFPEGNEPKIQAVAQALINKQLVEPLLIFTNRQEIPKQLDPKIKVLVIDEIDHQPFIDKFLAIRGAKTNLEAATKAMKNSAYIGAMLVKENQAQGMVCGLTFTTADTLRPALQIIKTKPNYPLAASVLIMRKDSEAFLFSDCALNINPSANELALIGEMSAEFSSEMGVKDPEMVLLSYSTHGSGQGPQVAKVQEAMTLLRAKKQPFRVEGEIQFDAAFSPEVRQKKAPQNQLTKIHPDIYVFPDLQSGNIGYKIAQRLGNYEAAGPFILGLNSPVNDLSRGASFADIYETAIITAFQALQIKKENHDSCC